MGTLVAIFLISGCGTNGVSKEIQQGERVLMEDWNSSEKSDEEWFGTSEEATRLN